MSDKIVGIFERISQGKSGEQAVTADNSALEPYRAALTERPGKRAWSIRFYHSNGEVEQINYSHRKYDLSVQPDRLGISFTTGVIMLTGKNLRLLLDDLQDERIRALQPFDPARHKAPKADEPFIETIAWKGLDEVKQAARSAEGN